jgi:hypothetical protein
MYFNPPMPEIPATGIYSIENNVETSNEVTKTGNNIVHETALRYLIITAKNESKDMEVSDDEQG